MSEFVPRQLVSAPWFCWLAFHSLSLFYSAFAVVSVEGHATALAKAREGFVEKAVADAKVAELTQLWKDKATKLTSA